MTGPCTLDLEEALPADLYRRDDLPHEAAFLAGSCLSLKHRLEVGSVGCPVPRSLPRSSGSTAIKGLTLLLSILVVACTADDASPVTSRSGAPTGRPEWQQLRVTGNEVEGYSTIQGMSARADAVITATISSVEPGRVFQGDASEDRVYYARLILKVDQRLRGDVDAGPVPMELLLPQVFDDDGFVDAVADLGRSAAGDRILVFLRRKSDSRTAIYRPVSSAGLFASTARAVVDTPLAEEPPAGSGLYKAELVNVGTLEDLAALVSASR